ncbi:hypothetical protein AB1Y20_005806 [Prymnesium parvum]|uniref:Beta-galactosidase n=1 Tax=Prymnesium parvum TaxID=97485 RepID=A0AB34J360_PRYPA
MNGRKVNVAESYKFEETGDGLDEAYLARRPLEFYNGHLKPDEHGMHPSQRVLIETVDFGADRDEQFAPWATKEFSHGAIPKSYPYKRGTLGYGEGFAGYRPMWRPPENPLDGGKSADIYVSGIATYPGYQGNRPGERSEPYITGKVNVDDKRALVPWQGQARDSSMASRIAQRRLEAHSKKAPPWGDRMLQPNP